MRDEKDKTWVDDGYITKKIEKILAEDASDDSISQELDMGDTIKLDGIGDIESDVSENLGNGLVDTKKNEEEIILKSSEQDDEELEKDKVDEEKVEDNGKLQGNKKRNQKRKVIITGCCILAVVIIVISLVIFFKLNDSEEIIEEEEHVLTLSEQREIINKYGKTVEDVIGVYFRKNNVLLEYEDAAKLVKLKNKVNCSVHDVYEDGLIFLDKCVIDGKTTKARYGTKQEAKEEVVKKEGNVHVYVNKTNSEATLIKPKYMDVYDDYSFDIDGVYSNLTLLDAKKSDYVFYIGDRENVFMINFKTGEKFLPQINYQAVLPIKNGDVFDTYRIGVLVDNKWGIYDIQSGSCVIYPRYDSISVNLSLGTSGPPVYASAPQPDMLVVNYNGAVGVIDYRNNKEIIPIIYNGILSSGDYLWAIDSKSIGHIYDFSGNVYLDNEYDKVYGIVDGKYVMVNDKDSIKLVLLNKDLVYDYGKLELGECSYFLSYNGGALFQFSKKDASGCVEVIYDGENKKGSVEDIQCGGIAKPVLYLYPKRKEKVEVSFSHPEYLETTYPKYDGKWEVEASKNGNLKDKSNKRYYGLYWDEVKVHSVDFDEGFYVEEKDALKFLEEKLEAIGLNWKEANEFIMYWLPVLEKNKKSLVYFELTEERESYNKININPKPDSLLRMVIHIKKVPKNVNIKEQNLPRFKRRGFVAVEWGGTNY